MALAAAWLGGCSSPSAPPPTCFGLDASIPTPSMGTCPEDRPSACPDAGVPSYQADIAPLTKHKCGPCHEPGGVEAIRPYTQYDPLAGALTRVLTQVYQCHMPPACAPQLTPEERRELLVWLVCGAPDN